MTIINRSNSNPIKLKCNPVKSGRTSVIFFSCVVISMQDFYCPCNLVCDTKHIVHILQKDTQKGFFRSDACISKTTSIFSIFQSRCKISITRCDNVDCREKNRKQQPSVDVQCSSIHFDLLPLLCNDITFHPPLLLPVYHLTYVTLGNLLKDLGRTVSVFLILLK